MEEFLRWENLVFFLPLLGSLLYIVMFASGLGASKDLDGDHDLDLDSDLDHDLDHGQPDFEHDVEHGGFLHNMLAILGVGRVPVSILIMSLGMLWGFAGYACMQLTGNVMYSLAIAGISSLAGTSLIALTVGKLVPKVQTFALSNRELIGHTGSVLDEVTDLAGTVRVTDPHGSILDLPARVRPGEKQIPKGEKVTLVRYESGAFYVSKA